MNFNKKLSVSAVALLSLLLSGFLSYGQITFKLGVGATPNPVQINNSLIYTLYLTNIPLSAWTNVYITNKFSAPVVFTGQYSSPTNQPAFTNSTEIVFPVTNLTINVSTYSFTLLPQTAGVLTNQITALATGFTNTLVTSNYTTLVSAPTADLAIAMTNATTGAFAGGTTTIGLTITNKGPESATGVVVTNKLPASFGLLSFTPTNASTTFANGVLTWTIGSLTNGEVTQLLASVRPTNSGTFNYTASVAASTSDPNSTNNTVTNSIIVEEIQSTNLSSVVSSPQTFNPQTGLMEEVVRVTNNDTIPVDAVRLSVTGLGTNRLYNATGTNNNGTPYVQHNATVNTNAFVDFRLEYFVRTRTPLTNLTYSAVGLTFTSPTVPTNLAPVITAKGNVPSGFLIEFQSIPGRSYTILYTEITDMSFTNAKVAQPVVVAPADRVQWIDSGPPKTISLPANASSRIYRVLLNP